MGNIRKWSKTATGNATVAGGVNTINFAEGQTPGSVNNSAREMMAQVRSIYEPDEWGWVEFSATASIVSQTSFKIAGNQTTQWVSGRRWRLKSGSTTRYGSVLSSTFTAETLVSVSVDSGSLSASHSLVALSILDTNQFNNKLARRDTTNSYSATQVFAAGFVSQAVGVIEVTDNTNAALRVTQLGTGLALRIEDSANPDSTPFVVDASGNVGIGTTSLTGQLNIDAANVSSYITETGASYRMVLRGFNSNAGYYSLREDGAARTAIDFDNTNQILYLKTAGTNQFKLDASGNFLGVASGAVGYGTGSGGTVTQLTSKSTGVTLNKTNGQIITANSALASVTEVAFTVTNSTVAATDTVIVSKVSGGSNIKYEVFIGAMAAGSFDVVIRNISGTSGSDVLTINFAVIKAVTS